MSELDKPDSDHVRLLCITTTLCVICFSLHLPTSVIVKIQIWKSKLWPITRYFDHLICRTRTIIM